MTNWTELKRLAEAAIDDFGVYDPRAAEREFMSKVGPADVLALIAENERLNRESQNLSDQLGRCDRERRELMRERDQLRAEVEALRKDAERYRWLRGHHGLSLKGHDFISYGEVADFRIDNAMTVVKADG